VTIVHATKLSLIVGGDWVFINTTNDSRIKNNSFFFFFLIHHKKQPDNTQVGYCVVAAANNKYQQPSLTELIGYGTSDSPYSAKLAEVDYLPHLVVIPYGKTKDCPNKFSVLAFTKSNKKVKLKELTEWECTASVDGEWKGKTAGGAQAAENEKTWHKNPFFSLVIPKKGKLDLAIVLAQKQSAMDAAALVPYQQIPYPFHIGFYLFDSDVEHLIGQCKKWKNAKEVFCNFTLDGSKGTTYTIVPTTFKAKEETSFTIHVLSTSDVQLKKFADSES